MNRTTFIVDGFNMYHSVEEAARQLAPGSRGTKWLNLRKLCASYLHVIGGGAQIEKSKGVAFAFPFARKNNELAQLVKTSFHIRKEAYVAHQFSDPVHLSDGCVISKPPTW